jgi:hypothetical protein
VSLQGVREPLFIENLNRFSVNFGVVVSSKNN